MISANELRIGNLVYLTDEESSPKNTLHKVGKHSFDLCDCLNPIPLATEILENSGFIKSSQAFVHFKLGSIYFIKRENYFLVKGGINIKLTSVKTVHHFQNFYHAITGEELTINL